MLLKINLVTPYTTYYSIEGWAITTYYFETSA
jgi:hypothetical protein